MTTVRNLTCREVTLAQLRGQGQGPDSGVCTVTCTRRCSLSLFGSVNRTSPLDWGALLSYSLRSTNCLGTLLWLLQIIWQQGPLSLQVPVTPTLSPINNSPSLAKKGPHSSSLHCILVLLWCEMVSRARLEWISCSVSGRVVVLTDLSMALPSSRSLQRTGPDGGVTGAPSWAGQRGTSPPSCRRLTDLCSGRITLVWKFFFNCDFHATCPPKGCEMVCSKTCLKQDS